MPPEPPAPTAEELQEQEAIDCERRVYEELGRIWMMSYTKSLRTQQYHQLKRIRFQVRDRQFTPELLEAVNKLGGELKPR